MARDFLSSPDSLCSWIPICFKYIRLTPKESISVLMCVSRRVSLGILGGLGVFCKAILSRRISLIDMMASSMRIVIPRIVL